MGENVTLSDEERVCLLDSINFYDDEADDLWGEVENIIAIRLDARDQALREEIARLIEDARDDMLRVTKTDPRHPLARVYDDAARIARGGAR